ncbi:hypothetical protein [Metabacillus iocasae]|uniref:Ion transporter superfamily protein YfcC n=1 Tax=Priestia iocasae TaxID=2291674 RepID=A0ABS2QUM8_9BACI|nr:hypothetical protein [Metabacillus iocasae]MBM7703194.1 putative ion transporter superfamily protein YfcC [Metabacillus iocasae]
MKGFYVKTVRCILCSFLLLLVLVYFTTYATHIERDEQQYPSSYETSESVRGGISEQKSTI